MIISENRSIMIDVGGVASWGGFVPFRPSRQNYRHKGTSMKICKILDCNNKHFGKDYCQKHYTRFWKYGDPFHVEKEMHGMGSISEYRTWADMIQRCHNKNRPIYKYYGGRGITICDRWRKSFKVFFEDMGPKPFPNAQIDRIDNDLGYYPENCRWVMATENMRHTSTTKLTMQKAKAIRKEYKSINITQSKLADIYGVSLSTIAGVIYQRTWKEEFSKIDEVATGINFQALKRRRRA